MKSLLLVLIVLVFNACRGEPVPRDYQNHPPSMTNPVDNSAEAPSQQSTNLVNPEPSYGVEGTSVPREPAKPLPTPKETTGTTATSAMQPPG